MGEKARLISARVVLDTNCVVSALVFANGRLAWMRRAWQDDLFTPLVSGDTVRELIRVLNYPRFQLTQMEQETLLAEFLPYTETCPTTAMAGPSGLRDPDDAIFIVLAGQAGADLLVSGDEDLLQIDGRNHSFDIVSPRQFESWLKGQTER
jgi:hypothetical protein